MRVRRSRISEQVDSLLCENKVVAPPVPIERIVRSQGVRVTYAPLQSDISGFVYQQAGKPVVGVNSQHAHVRQRFTIAHELGHYLLHQRQEMHVDRAVQPRLRSGASADGTHVEEIEANSFAAQMLMPESFVSKDMECHSAVDVLDEEFLAWMAKRYDVSTQAMMLRLVNLGYVED